MRILVTGATGFVGSHLVEALRGSSVGAGDGGAAFDSGKDPYQHPGEDTSELKLRALVRTTSDTRQLQELGIETLTGHLGDPESLRRATTDSQAVLHLAALTRARNEKEFRAVNETGTRLLLDAARESGTCRRFVYVSSLAAAGPSVAGEPVNAAHEPRPLTAYGRSKLAGEKACARNAGNLSVIVLRPPAVYGPRDRDLLPFFRLAARGFLPVPRGPERRLQLIYVADLARAIRMAAFHPGPAPDDIEARSPGNRRQQPRDTADSEPPEIRSNRAKSLNIYHIAESAAYSWIDVLDLIARAVGRRGRRIPVPETVLEVAGGASGLAGRILNRPQIFDRDKVRELLAPGWLCETEAALDDLGFRARISLADGMRETAAWYREKGWIS